MPFPPKRDHRITLAEAIEMTTAHRAAAGSDAAKGGMWPREVFEALLAQPGCAGLRMYHGRLKDGTANMVMVAVDANGSDLTSATIMEQFFPCPPWCDTASPLYG
ncbi:MAG TPA: hypothetical protein VFI13_13055 [Gemmatimonadales bacterium]|nr:hypothetical protein [Gemmatimonadales bacterium]